MKKDNNLEELRIKLYEAINNSNLIDKEVIELSQKLDLEILEFYKLRGVVFEKGIKINV